MPISLSRQGKQSLVKSAGNDCIDRRQYPLYGLTLYLFAGQLCQTSLVNLMYNQG